MLSCCRGPMVASTTAANRPVTVTATVCVRQAMSDERGTAVPKGTMTGNPHNRRPSPADTSPLRQPPHTPFVTKRQDIRHKKPAEPFGSHDVFGNVDFLLRP